MNVPIGILCQSPVKEGSTAADAVRATVALAKEADTLGYTRFWVAEHHSDRALASGAPEVLIAHLASVTERIRVGAGGILLPYHSPFHVAEQFNLLAALFPGRIDLGLGRGGGSEGHAPQALGVRTSGDGVFTAIDELLSWLGEGTAARPWSDTFASPPVAPADPWVLGTSPASATYAGRRGLPFAFGGFLDPRGLTASLTAYHQSFQPSRWLRAPRVLLAWYVQAAHSEAEARALTQSSERWFVETLLRGQNPPFPKPGPAPALGPMEQMAIAMRREFALVGTADQVRDGLDRLVRTFHVDELMLVTLPWDEQARRESYRLLAGALAGP